ncbi:DoxX family protein [Breoghania sp. L-A4]|uniref:DoxX family protein n=1 Tax=Breoghania sp. L-A4 TaxID=2304600 RepID=UPI000E35F792|nr:DoxX family protein [Breoghania sp. L-A4]AXS41396.1 DoxX family protein [Breoghania sp. L-A4]
MPADSNAVALAATLQRVALGVMFLAHSLFLKLIVYTLPGTAQFFTSIGLPGWFAYVIFTVETAAGVMLVLGIQARWVALAVAPVLAGATWAHSGNGWMFGYENGGWEYPAYLTLLSISQFLLGDGRLALVPSRPAPQGFPGLSAGGRA